MQTQQAPPSVGPRRRYSGGKSMSVSRTLEGQIVAFLVVHTVEPQQITYQDVRGRYEGCAIADDSRGGCGGRA